MKSVSCLDRIFTWNHGRRSISKWLFIFMIPFIISCNGPDKNRNTLENPFFAFHNSLNKKDLPFIPLEEQAAILKKYNFDGIEHTEISGLLDLIDVFDRHGLKVYADYLRIDIDENEPYLSEWKNIIPKLEGTEMILWVHIHSKKFKPSDQAADKIVVPILNELADLCEPYGIRIAIYHHAGFLAERAEDSFRLAEKINRTNVGSVFNLCHFLKVEPEKNLEQVIDLTLPKLFAVSISGADTGHHLSWDRLIQPLGQGSFDVYHLVELLANRGYQGPIGLQCYNLKGDPEIYLSQSSKTWNEFKEKYNQSSKTQNNEFEN